MAKSKSAGNTVPYYLELTGAKFDWEQYAPAYPQWRPLTPSAIRIDIPANLVERIVGPDNKEMLLLSDEAWMFITKYMYDLNRKTVSATRIPPTNTKGV